MPDAQRLARAIGRRRLATAWARARHAAPVPVYLACLALFLACLGGAAWHASRQGLQRAEQRANDMAAAVLRGVEAIDAQIDAALAKGARARTAGATCGSEDIARMQALQSRYIHIGAMARLAQAGDRIRCSTFGPEADGLLLGPADYFIGRGARRVHRLFMLPMHDGATYFVVSDGQLALFVHNGVAATILSALPQAALGAYIRHGGPIVFSRGPHDLEALQALEHSGRSTAFDGRQLLAIGVSQRTEYIAYVGFSAARVQASIDDERAMLLPLGALLGLALSALLFVFLRNCTSMAASLGRALQTERIYMDYQPIVDLRTGQCIGAEALVRWRRRSGLVPPDRFIAAAERAGIMPLVTRRIVQLVASDMADLLRRHPALHVSINFSALDLRADRATTLLSSLLRVTGLPADSFWVEITETSFVEEDLCRTLDSIRALGFKVAIDDFGTGYANLGMLTRIEVDMLKIDKRFVQSAVQTGPGSEVAIAIIGLARSLALQMVAEGVETQAQADFLRRSGVQFAQGWLFGRPGSVAALQASIARQQGPAPAAQRPG